MTSPVSMPNRDKQSDTVEKTLEAEDNGLEHLQIRVRRSLVNRRLDKYLSGRMGRDFSRTALKRYINEGNVTVNGRTVKPSYTIRAGDVIDMSLPPRTPPEIPPEPIPIDVVYEDDDILAINKQADIIVHPARGNWTGTLVNALAYYFKANWRNIGDLPVAGEAFRPGIVHRLDRDTTGVMLIAKSDLALWRLGRQFETRKVQKTYRAIVHGLVELDADVIDVPIGKHPTIREKFSVHRVTGRPYPGVSKPAVTEYRVLERIGRVGPTGMGFTMLQLHPRTGRTHQIRVHVSYIGHPIVGDRMYGGGPLYLSQLKGHANRAKGPLITRQALHAESIEFDHPRTAKKMKIEAPMPDDFNNTLRALKEFSHEV